MNKDIKLMIELQGYWTGILNGNSSIKRSENSISHWNTELSAKKREKEKLEKEIRQTKITINEKETELAENDNHIKKIAAKKDIVKTEKELTALEHEYEKAINDKNTLEDLLLGLFDTVEEKEKQLNSLIHVIEEMSSQTQTDVANLEGEIIHSGKSVEENKALFDQMIDQLSPAVKAKFLKLIKSPNGLGIAKLQGEICGACNYQIPFNLTQDIKKEGSIISCTNCGRFLYI